MCSGNFVTADERIVKRRRRISIARRRSQPYYEKLAQALETTVLTVEAERRVCVVYGVSFTFLDDSLDLKGYDVTHRPFWWEGGGQTST